MIKNWRTIDTKHIGDFRIFDLYQHKREHPVTNKCSDFFALTTTDWVNIIPVTVDGEVVLVEQYRHGIDAVTLEFPAGLMEQNEVPRFSAERECIEETGYAGVGEAIYIGKVCPNPAFLNNFCHHFLWTDCVLQSEQNLDENENINVVKVSFDELNRLIKDGTINHSLVISALYYYSKFMLVI